MSHRIDIFDPAEAKRLIIEADRGRGVTALLRALIDALEAEVQARAEARWPLPQPLSWSVCWHHEGSDGSTWLRLQLTLTGYSANDGDPPQALADAHDASLTAVVDGLLAHIASLIPVSHPATATCPKCWRKRRRAPAASGGSATAKYERWLRWLDKLGPASTVLLSLSPPRERKDIELIIANPQPAGLVAAFARGQRLAVGSFVSRSSESGPVVVEIPREEAQRLVKHIEWRHFIDNIAPGNSSRLLVPPRDAGAGWRLSWTLDSGPAPQPRVLHLTLTLTHPSHGPATAIAVLSQLNSETVESAAWSALSTLHERREAPARRYGWARALREVEKSVTSVVWPFQRTKDVT